MAEFMELNLKMDILIFQKYQKEKLKLTILQTTVLQILLKPMKN